MTPISIVNFLKTTRQYFWSKNFTEVEINYLNSALPLEPNLYSFKVNNWYLPTSPEFALKQYLAKNQSDCFAIAHSFRDLESTSPQHTNEFLMLEWYEVNKNLDDLKKSTQEYISKFLNCEFINYELPSALPDNEPDFNQYFLNEIEPTLPRDKAVFITGYPAFLSPLAKSETDYGLRVTNYQIAQRFELYINGIEIANACVENRDAESIKSAFLKEQKYRLDHHLPSHPISENFIQDCASLPPCCGIGLGIDRLLGIINT